MESQFQSSKLLSRKRRSCRYGSNCNRKDTTCRFLHPPPPASHATNGNNAAATPPPPPCRYGIRCHFKDTTCTFFHPRLSPSIDNNNNGNSDTTQVCRYGIQCWSKHCRRTHPPGWNPADNNNSSNNNSNKAATRPPPAAAAAAAAAAQGVTVTISGIHNSISDQSVTKITGRATTNNNDNSNKSSVSTTTPEHEMEKGFYSGPQLRQADADGYRAAGILLVRRRRRTGGNTRYYEATTTANNNNNNDYFQVLLCAELRKKKQTELNLLGGKVETEDGQDARQTAAREFWEETGRMVSLNDCQQLLQQRSTTTVWCGPGKYVLFIVGCDSDDNQQQWDELPSRYHHMVESGIKPPGAEPDYLVWVDCGLILRQQKKDNKPMTIPVPSSNGHAAPILLSLNVSRFTQSLLKNACVQQSLQSVIQEMKLSAAAATAETHQLTTPPTNSNGNSKAGEDNYRLPNNNNTATTKGNNNKNNNMQDELSESVRKMTI